MISNRRKPINAKFTSYSIAVGERVGDRENRFNSLLLKLLVLYGMAAIHICIWEHQRHINQGRQLFQQGVEVIHHGEWVIDKHIIVRSERNVLHQKLARCNVFDHRL